ncbi:type III secretion system inner membrane ring lipoprotein SctJ [Burkholderia ubonensis]|uniref:type III secretion system inner membrane ring lipoprotein SctJ n=1 Tax=Burkholderia ubonensis TaxID=101571 RepID=UPI000AEE7503|nr:type III secretion inner membrane ring lipoprotein SctJ [Burkholderia ubonensis]
MTTMFLAGCGQAALFDQISESDANEMLSVLGRAGIAAQKSQRSADGWRLQVAPSDVSLALEMLNSAGLPRERYKSIGELFPKEGLVSTPVEEHMRAIYAISQELSRTISAIDGVITTRVHLNIPKQGTSLRNVPPPTASVFVKYRAEVNMQQNVLPIKDLVIGAVKDLDHAAVTVALFPWSPNSTIQASTEYTQAMGIAVSPRSYARLLWLVLLPWAMLAMVVGAAIMLGWSRIERNLLGEIGESRLARFWRRVRDKRDE